MFLIIGLGNPGSRYELTRHNAGFLVVDSLAEKHRIKLTQHKYSSLYGQGEIDGIGVIVAKPATYMNHSGKAAKSLLSALKVLPEHLIVVHDDIDLPLGKIKIKNKGGDSGQLGIRSIREKIQTDLFNRVRVGVGRPDDPEDIVDYVLSPFADEELITMNDVIEQAVRMVELTLRDSNIEPKLTED